MLVERIRRLGAVLAGTAISLFAVSSVAAAEAVPQFDGSLALLMPTAIILALVGDMALLLMRQPDDESWNS